VRRVEPRQCAFSWGRPGRPWANPARPASARVAPGGAGEPQLEVVAGGVRAQPQLERLGVHPDLPAADLHPTVIEQLGPVGHGAAGRVLGRDQFDLELTGAPGLAELGELADRGAHPGDQRIGGEEPVDLVDRVEVSRPGGDRLQDPAGRARHAVDLLGALRRELVPLGEERGVQLVTGGGDLLAELGDVAVAQLGGLEVGLERAERRYAPRRP
jgi:hypothetical protein